MRIAYMGIKGLPSKGGAERVVEALSGELSLIHEMTVYCSAHYTPANVNYRGIRIIRIPCLRGKHLHMISCNLLAALHALIFGHYDIIHVNNLEAGFIIPLLKLKFNVIATAHGRIGRNSKWSSCAVALIRLLEAPFYRYADIITSVSREQADSIRRRSSKSVHHIPNGVERNQRTNFVSARGLLAREGLGNRPYLLLAAGRIIPLKGVHIFIEAMTTARIRMPALIIGDFSQETDYVKELKDRLPSNILLSPFITERDVLFGLIQMSALFIFPSLEEAMSIVLLEAASVGAPIICSDISANKSVLTDKGALYFKSGDPETLARKIEWALAHPETMRMIGARGQEIVKRNFCWSDIAAKYEGLYEGQGTAC